MGLDGPKDVTRDARKLIESLCQIQSLYGYPVESNSSDSDIYNILIICH